MTWSRPIRTVYPKCLYRVLCKSHVQVSLEANREVNPCPRLQQSPLNVLLKPAWHTPALVVCLSTTIRTLVTMGRPIGLPTRPKNCPIPWGELHLNLHCIVLSLELPTHYPIRHPDPFNRFFHNSLDRQSVQGAPINNIPLEKMLYFSHCSTDLIQIFRLYEIRATYIGLLQILLK